MKKCFRKVIAFVLTVATVFSTASVTYAAPENGTDENSIYELEQFLGMNGELIEFDSESALENGFSNDVVMAVKNNITNMNALVTQGIAYIDENYAAVILLPSTRARGESKIVSYWYGLIEIYMNSDETDALIEGLSNIGSTTSWSTMLGYLPGHLVNALSNLGGMMSLSATVSVSLIEKAAAGGNGIIMRVHTNVITGGVPVISYVSQ